MKNLSFPALVAFASLCAVLPAQAQVVQADPSQPGGYPLKNGSAKPLIQEKCVACHDLRRGVNSNKDPEEWRDTVHMKKAAGALINDAQVKENADHFNANDPRLEGPQPVIIAGHPQDPLKTR